MGTLELVGLLLCLSMIIGVVGPISGVGGGVMFTPIIIAFTHINPDIVRGTGLLLAMTNSLISAKPYVRRGLANFKLALFLSAPMSLSSALGAVCGLWITGQLGRGVDVVKGALGVLVLAISLILMKGGNRVEWPENCGRDRLAELFGLSGSFWEESINKRVDYIPSNIPWGLLGGLGIGFIAGFFGLGAGWANVPLLNLVMCLPLKAAAATSVLVIGMANASSLLVYAARGHLIPLFALPCLIGSSLGSMIGARLMAKARAGTIRRIVVGVMSLAGIRLLLTAVGV